QPTPCTTLFPYTTLFRSWSDSLESLVGNPLLVETKSRLRTSAEGERAVRQLGAHLRTTSGQWALLLYGDGPELKMNPSRWVKSRSEEHTSELQSRGHLVC